MIGPTDVLHPSPAPTSGYSVARPCRFSSIQTSIKNKNKNPGRGRFFFSPKRPDRRWGPPTLLINGYRGSFPHEKRQGREVINSPPSKAEVKNGWSYTSSPPIRLHGVDKENFTSNYIGDNWNTAIW